MSQGQSEIRSLAKRMVHRLPPSLRNRLIAFRKSHTQPLVEQLPLPLPETMHIDPANACNFRCQFCPTADPELLASVGRPKGIMDYDLFRKIIDDLKRMVDRHGRPLSILHLYKDGEPLLNKHLVEMADYAKAAGVTRIVSTTSNGAILKEDIAERLLRSGLDQLRISVIHVTSERYKELTQTFGDYEKIKKNVGYAYEMKKKLKSRLLIVAKTNDVGLTMDEKQKFLDDFRPISDVQMIDSMMGWSFSELKDFTLGVTVATGMDSVSPLKDRKVCPEPFSRLAVNFDGKVSVCCVDWSYGTIVGDLVTEDLDAIWRGEALRQFRLTHLQGKRSEIPACNNCQYVLGSSLWRDLDDHAARLVPAFAEGTRA